VLYYGAKIWYQCSRAIAVIMSISLNVCQSVWDKRAFWSYGAF